MMADEARHSFHNHCHTTLPTSTVTLLFPQAPTTAVGFRQAFGPAWAWLGIDSNPHSQLAIHINQCSQLGMDSKPHSTTLGVNNSMRE